MTRAFDFYFDFGSPYTYLAHKQIRNLEKENSIKIKYQPVLLGGLLKSAGLKANVDIVNNYAEVNLLDPEYGISPGQACVFYSIENGNKVLGGGWISK